MRQPIEITITLVSYGLKRKSTSKKKLAAQQQNQSENAYRFCPCALASKWRFDRIYSLL